MAEAADPADLLDQHDEPHTGGFYERLNWLRAAVLGANDGIISTAGIVIGVAAATTSRANIATAGFAGLAAGAMSMAVGEYVSVSTQRDAEVALLAKEKQELEEDPVAELEELTQLLADKGISDDLARQVAVELTENDPLTAHAEVELGIDPEALTKPWHAAWASFFAFTAGAILPLVAILLVGVTARVPVTVAAVVLALIATGWISARLGSAEIWPAVRRNVVGGLLAMTVTYAIGSLVGTQV
ncbi:membrane protein [Knoellia sinensis KCTC 19936]|uniref:Membrane protein n=1 Tax=Knoellia sinensis KCTC 19936 TaxID=1385520 RepID=A0A0A0JCE3_9MICO|nr:VIT family protein [Knoellia sinensis]KGN33682.1 membrane protein [Knoellia sinensis KCTC 19936]